MSHKVMEPPSCNWGKHTDIWDVVLVGDACYVAQETDVV